MKISKINVKGFFEKRLHLVGIERLFYCLSLGPDCKIIKVFPGWVISYILIGKQELGTNWRILSMLQVTVSSNIGSYLSFKLLNFRYFSSELAKMSRRACVKRTVVSHETRSLFFINPLLFVHSLKLMRWDLWFVNCNIKNPV